MRQSDTQTLSTRTPEETRAFGMRLGQAIKRASTPLLVTLRGELGAGKTTLVSGVVAAFGLHGAVRSPTYTLIEPYDFGDHTLYHIDLYRLANASELEQLGIREMMHAGATMLVEWPERAAEKLPTPDVEIELRYANSGREIYIRAHTERGVALTAQIASS